MEKVRVKCPDCGRIFRVASSYLGRKGQCSKCDHAFTLVAIENVAESLEVYEFSSLATPPVEAVAEPPPPTQSGVSSVTLEPTAPVQAGPCPMCGQDLAAEVVLCINCGYNRKTGQALQTVTEEEDTDDGPHTAWGQRAAVFQERETLTLGSVLATVPWTVLYRVALVGAILLAVVYAGVYFTRQKEVADIVLQEQLVADRQSDYDRLKALRASQSSTPLDEAALQARLTEVARVAMQSQGTMDQQARAELLRKLKTDAPTMQADVALLQARQQLTNAQDQLYQLKRYHDPLPTFELIASIAVAILLAVAPLIMNIIQRGRGDEAAATEGG